MMLTQKKLHIAVAIVFAAFYLFLLVYQSQKVAITDDARFYMTAAKKYAAYFENCKITENCHKDSTIKRYWTENHEHPPFAKLLMAGGYIVFHKKLGWLDEIRALRIGISIFSVIVLLFIFSFVLRAFSFHAAVFSSLFFIFLPRTFFHARVATLDFAVAGMSFIFVYSYWRSLSSKKWEWLTGIVFGIAISTKLNAPFMIVPVLAHYIYIKKDVLLKKPVKTIFAPQFVSMLLFSMPVFFLMWPWLWHDTFKRFAEYVMFHTNHYGILMYYLGDVFSEPRPAWHAPMVMMLLTTPVMTLFFSFVSPIVHNWKKERNNFHAMLLVLLSGFVSIAVLMFMPAPFYSGVKLFQPFFPFLAIVAGVGMYYTLKNVTFIPEKYRFAPAVLFFLPVIFSMIDLKHDHLSYFNEIAGGTKGALEYRTERHYYDLYYYELTEFFNKACKKKRCRVSFEPNGKEYGPSAGILKRAGYLTKTYDDSKPEAANYLVLTHEYRWRNYPFLLRNYKSMKKVFTLKRQGVELVTVFEEFF